jgi:hypothetical protein
VNSPHEEGKRSRVSDTTMMTKRSSHIPTEVITAMRNSHVRIRANFAKPQNLRRQHVTEKQAPIRPAVRPERAVHRHEAFVMLLE